MEGVQIINFGNRVNKLTSILFMSIDSVRILYVSYSSRTNHVLNKVLIYVYMLCSCYEQANRLILHHSYSIHSSLFLLLVQSIAL